MPFRTMVLRLQTNWTSLQVVKIFAVI